MYLGRYQVKPRRNTPILLFIKIQYRVIVGLKILYLEKRGNWTNLQNWINKQKLFIKSLKDLIVLLNGQILRLEIATVKLAITGYEYFAWPCQLTTLSRTVKLRMRRVLYWWKWIIVTSLGLQSRRLIRMKKVVWNS